MRSMSFLAVLLTVSALALLGPAAAPAAAPWQCSPGYCKWGFNHMGSGVNEYVKSPWNYWYDQWLDKWSGDTIQIGLGPVDGCYRNRNGVGAWYMRNAADYGCAGYIYHYMRWFPGNHESYLFVDTYV
jgi:hypothetical protein